MNAMANKTDISLESLQYFVVPASWFLKARPLLTTRSPNGIQEEWRDQIGMIQNVELLDQNAQNAVSSSDEDDTNSPEIQKKRFEKLHLQTRNRKQSVMRSGLTHTKDYFFLGPSAWMLVKEKFGFDGHELGRYCVFTGTGNHVLAIQLQEPEVEEHQSRLIPIPPSGRFAYEKIVPTESSISASTSDIVPEEEEEGNASVRAIIQSHSFPCFGAYHVWNNSQTIYFLF
jgi:hypothetical protein